MDVVGTSKNDELTGITGQANTIRALSGDDYLSGEDFADWLSGGKGNDFVWGGGGDDQIWGNTGNDTLYGTEGADTALGGEGNDFISGGKGDDIVAGGRGDDVVNGNTGDDKVLGGSGNDVISGTAGNDFLDGGRGNDAVSGGSGDDYALVSSGTDSYSGGSGTDVLDFSRILGSVNVDLSKKSASFGPNGKVTTDSVSGFEIVIGNDADGRYQGADKSSTWFVGGSGNDWFRGKAGDDRLTGGEGSDTFAYLKKDTVGGGVDTITDFQVGQDHLDMTDFLKGRQGGYDSNVRFVDAGEDTVVQGLVNKQWVDVVVLDNVDFAAASSAFDTILAA